MSAGPAPARRARAPHAEERLRRAAVVAPPRRVSGAAHPRAVPAPVPPPLGRWADALRALPDARWVDRLLRGRAWIALIAAALIGIVAMQVHLLKLNSGIGRAVESAATLERQNAGLRHTVARLSSRERILAEAGKQGLVLPPAGDVRYVRTRADRDVRAAVKTMRAPDPPAPPVAATTATPTGVAATPDPATATATATSTATTTTPTATATPTTTAAPTATSTPAAPAVTPDPAPAVTPDPAAAAAPATAATGAAVAPEG